MSSQHKMGPVMLTALVTGNMMGSGVFLLPANLATIGSISTIGWLITTVGAISLALVFSKLGLMNPRAGGPYAYAKSGFGDYLGFQTVCVYWFGNWVGNVAIAIAGIGYLSFFFPWLNNPVHTFVGSLIAVWLFTSINFFGARFLGRVQSTTTLFMFVPVLGTAFLGWFWFNPEIFMQSMNVSGESNMLAISHAASLTLWAFIGVESASVSAGVVKNPKRDIPLATMIGTLLAAVAYILSSSAIMGIVPNKELAVSSAPFSLAASMALGPVAGAVTAACAVIACLGSLGGWMLLVGQSGKAAADDKLFPTFFTYVNKRDVPVTGLIVTAILMSLFLVVTISPNLSTQFEKITEIAVFLTLLPYLYTSVAMLILGYRFGLSKQDYLLWAVVAIVAVIYNFWAIMGEGFDVVYFGFIATLLTIPAYAWVLWNRRHINIMTHQAESLQNGIKQGS